MHYSIITGATNPILRSVADPIDHFDNELFKVARDMKLVCHEHDGVGLAAPQIGLPLRIIYTTQRKKTPK
jgi:peptide deformylase